MLKWVISFLILILSFSICSAQPPTGEIQKTQEMLEKERELRQRIEKPQKQFVEKIQVEGITLPSEQELQEITMPFEGRWLTQEEIQQAVDSIVQACKQKGYSEKELESSYQIKNNKLEIQVEESRD